MTTIQRIARRSKRLGQELVSSMANTHHMRVEGQCPRCETNTLWTVRPLSGYYRCLRCGRNPMEEGPQE